MVQYWSTTTEAWIDGKVSDCHGIVGEGLPERTPFQIEAQMESRSERQELGNIEVCIGKIRPLNICTDFVKLYCAPRVTSQPTRHDSRTMSNQDQTNAEKFEFDANMKRIMWIALTS